jgi:hypothetical protein
LKYVMKSPWLGQTLWESLTSEQRQAVLMAYEDSENETNLIPLSEIKRRFLKEDNLNENKSEII